MTGGVDEVEEDEASKCDNKVSMDQKTDLDRLLVEKLVSVGYAQTASGDMEFSGNTEEKI